MDLYTKIDAGVDPLAESTPVDEDENYDSYSDKQIGDRDEVDWNTLKNISLEMKVRFFPSPPDIKAEIFFGLFGI